jgi:hypothetical protein
LRGAEEGGVPSFCAFPRRRGTANPELAEEYWALVERSLKFLSNLQAEEMKRDTTGMRAVVSLGWALRAVP